MQIFTKNFYAITKSKSSFFYNILKFIRTIRTSVKRDYAMNYKQLRRHGFLLIVSFFLIQACTSGISGSISQSDQGEYAQYLQSDNKLLLTRIGIKDIKAGQAGDLMRTNIVLHNRWHITLDFSYQVRWYDKDGFEIDPESHPWRSIVLKGKADHTVQSTAPRASARHFKIFIKD